MTLTEAAKLCRNALGGQHEPCDVDDLDAAVLLMADHVLGEASELADHKQRLAAQSARLAATRSQVVHMGAAVLRLAGELDEAVADKNRHVIDGMAERLRQVVREEATSE